MQAALLLLALWADAAAPKVRIVTMPAAMAAKTAPNMNLPLLPPSAIPSAKFNGLQPVTLHKPLAYWVNNHEEAAALAEQIKWDLAAPAANDNGLNSELQAKIDSRLKTLAAQWEAEQKAINFDADGGLGHVAEIAVIRHELPRLININEEVQRNGLTLGEIDAETHNHLIDVAAGRLDSGKKSKVQQFIKFLRQEAKKRGKPVRYYFNPRKADPEDIDRIIEIGRRAGVSVEFLPIPWGDLPN